MYFMIRSNFALGNQQQAAEAVPRLAHNLADPGVAGVSPGGTYLITPPNRTAIQL
jgi:hypothetical protein